MLSRVRLEVKNRVAWLLLDNPTRNVIDVAMMEELAERLASIEAMSEVHATVVKGVGGCFSSGVDVTAHTPDLARLMLEKFHAVIRAVVLSKKVTIAMVHGFCLGGGAELAMVCDLVYTSDDATWGFPEIQIGCFPPVAITVLSSLISPKRAAELILTGKTISGAEAGTLGLATKSVPAEELGSAVSDTLDRLSRLSPAVLAHSKKAAYAWDAIHFDKGLARAEKIYLQELINTEDAQEGIRAFLEKRNPHWKNR